MRAHDICSKAAELVAGDRERTHGAKLPNHQNIADLWNAYLGAQLAAPLTPLQIALMMALLKIARTKLGEFNIDDFLDGVGYTAIAGEIGST